MDALSNNPPLADKLALDYEKLTAEIAAALAGLAPADVTSDEEAAAVGEAVKPLKALQARVERNRVAEKDPYLEGERAVDKFFAGIRVELDKMVKAFADKVNAYQTKRREDARKIEAAKARIAVAVGESAPAPVAARETTRVVAETGRVAVSGAVKWDYEIVDASLLPRNLLMPNEAAIKACVAGLKATVRLEDAKIPGVRIFEKVQTSFR